MTSKDPSIVTSVCGYAVGAAFRGEELELKGVRTFLHGASPDT